MKKENFKKTAVENFPNLMTVIRQPAYIQTAIQD